MAKSSSGEFLKVLGIVAGAALMAASIIKAFSKDRRCVKCDRVIAAVNLLGTVCPNCVRVPFLKI
jgi:hypothetical protein